MLDLLVYFPVLTGAELIDIVKMRITKDIMNPVISDSVFSS